MDGWEFIDKNMTNLLAFVIVIGGIVINYKIWTGRGD